MIGWQYFVCSICSCRLPNLATSRNDAVMHQGTAGPSKQNFLTLQPRMLSAFSNLRLWHPLFACIKLGTPCVRPTSSRFLQQQERQRQQQQQIKRGRTMCLGQCIFSTAGMSKQDFSMPTYCEPCMGRLKFCAQSMCSGCLPREEHGYRKRRLALGGRTRNRRTWPLQVFCGHRAR